MASGISPLGTAMLLVAMAVGIAALLVVAPRLIVGPSTSLTEAELLEAEAQVRDSLIQALAGVALAFGAVLTSRTLQLTRRSQFNERLSKAIEAMASETDTARLGGVYSLERLARESPADCPAIVEIVVAYLRGNGGVVSGSSGQADPDKDAAFRILARRPYHRRERHRLRLAGLSFQDLRAQGGHFPYADLSYSKFERCNLRGSDFRGAVFYGGALRHSTAIAGDFQGASFTLADLSETFFCGANLAGASFVRANLSHSDFSGRRSGADWVTKPAVLAGASLKEAVLDGTILKGVDLSGVKDLTGQQVRAAVTDHETRLPAYLLHPDRA